jgi:hypothetical protein
MTPCTPPNWIPESVAYGAVTFYRGKLRKALVGFYKSQELKRNRAQSKDSDSLSLDSIQAGTYLAEDSFYDGIQSKSLSIPSGSN